MTSGVAANDIDKENGWQDTTNARSTARDGAASREARVMNKAHILVVEDEAVVAMDIEAALQSMDYEVAGTAATGEEAIAKALESRPDVVLMDIRLRGEMDGIEAAGRIRAQAAIPIIYLTAFADDELLARAKLTEPFGYILKPFETRELRSNIEMALYKQAMENKLRESYARLERNLEGTVEVISQLVVLRNPYLAKHQQRVARLAGAIAREMGMNEVRIKGIRLAASIHDLGIVKMPFEVVVKRGELSEAERALLQSHPEVGYGLLKDIEFLWPVAEVVRQHHEHLDGSGFPAGLKGDQILPESRIAIVANLVDGMVHGGPQNKPVGLEHALEWLLDHRDELYDPDVVDACVHLFREKGFSLEDNGRQ
jgi:putative two-component system response regulator